MLTKEQREQIIDEVRYAGNLVLNAEDEWVEWSDDVEPFIEEVETDEGAFYRVVVMAETDCEDDDGGVIYSRETYAYLLDEDGDVQEDSDHTYQYTDDFYHVTEDGLERIDD